MFGNFQLKTLNAFESLKENIIERLANETMGLMDNKGKEDWLSEQKWDYFKWSPISNKQKTYLALSN